MIKYIQSPGSRNHAVNNATPFFYISLISKRLSLLQSYMQHTTQQQSISAFLPRHYLEQHGQGKKSKTHTHTMLHYYASFSYREISLYIIYHHFFV